MVKNTQLALSDAAEWLGDWHPLAEQLGSADGLLELGSISAHLHLRPISNLETFRGFLIGYHEQVLFPIELPAIQVAHGHASRNELRELIAFDRQMAGEDMLQMFAAPSRRVGQTQLQKLRPLRDSRFVQRYLQAVDAGEAHAWHTLVYGLTMAIYSLPARQGLLGYAHQITRGFIYSAARMMHFSEHTCRGLFNEVSAGFPARVEGLLTHTELVAVV
jgi:urease accessory protein UreF